MRTIPTQRLAARLLGWRWLPGAVVLVMVSGTLAFLHHSPDALAATAPGATEIVSVTGSGVQGTADSESPDISADGRYITFDTLSPLDGLDNNNDRPSNSSSNGNREFDVYARDTVALTTTYLSSGRENQSVGPRVIVDVAANGDSFDSSESGDGRYVAFTTEAGNIVAGANSEGDRVVLCDRGLNSAGQPGARCTYTPFAPPGPTASQDFPSLAADGSRLAYLQGGHAEAVELGHDGTGAVNPLRPSAFSAPPVPATVVSGGVTFNYFDDINVALARGGRYLARVSEYSSVTENSLDVLWVTDLNTGANTRLDLDSTGAAVGSITDEIEQLAISGDGRRVAFTVGLFPDNHLYADPSVQSIVFAVDRDPDGDGVFGPAAGQPVHADVVSRDVTKAVVGARDPAFSTDGRYLAFATDAGHVHNGVDDTDKTVSCVHFPILENFTRTLPPPPAARGSRALRLAANTGISNCDVVVRDLVVDAQRAAAGQPPLPAELASPSTHTTCAAFTPGATCEGDGDSGAPALSADGSVVAFESFANDLGPVDTNNHEDVYLHRFQPTLTVDSVDFGLVVLGVAKTATVGVHHQGFGPLPLGAFTIGGLNATEFTVLPGGTCANAVLHETDVCQVPVSFTPAVFGARTATLTVTPLRGAPATGTLTGTGIAPTLVASPPLAPPGAVSKITGTGFPPGSQVLLTLDGMPGRILVTASATGTFTTPLVIFPHTEPGRRQLHATVQAVTVPIQVSIPFLVVPGSLQPPDFADRR